jgi:hypothetical protein
MMTREATSKTLQLSYLDGSIFSNWAVTACISDELGSDNFTKYIGERFVYVDYAHRMWQIRGISG